MKAPKKYIAVLCAVLLFVFTSCGNKNNPTDPAGEESGVTASDGDLATDGGVTEITEAATFVNAAEVNPTVVTEEITAVEAESYTEYTDITGFSGYTVGGMIKILSIGSYGGVVAVTVRNISDKDIEYMLLTANSGNSNVYFTLSVLPAGTQAIVTEKNLTAYKEGMVFTLWEIQNEIYFYDPLSLHENEIELYVADGSISIKNLTSKDIGGNVYVVYKDVENGIFTGNNSYRVSFDGLNAGQTKQISAEHFITGKSRVVYVSYGK